MFLEKYTPQNGFNLSMLGSSVTEPVGTKIPWVDAQHWEYNLN